MSILTPKFAVGEVVIVACVTFPRYNGEHTVRLIMESGDTYFDRILGKNLKTFPMPMGKHSRYGYVMEDILMDEDGYETIFDESVLRKKHQPGELSFEELLDDQRNEAVV